MKDVFCAVTGVSFNSQMWLLLCMLSLASRRFNTAASFCLLYLIRPTTSIKLLRRTALTSFSWSGGRSSGGTQQPPGWEWCPNRSSQPAGHIWGLKHTIREKTQSASAATGDSAGRELQVVYCGFKCTSATLRQHTKLLTWHTVKTECYFICATSRLEAAKDDYRIHCEELEKQLIELQHRNDELTSLAEESRALKDELDVLRFVFVK